MCQDSREPRGTTPSLVPRKTRSTIATGIYKDRFGYEVRWRLAGKEIAKRFPLDTPVSLMQRFRTAQVLKAIDVKRAPRGSFTRIAVRFLRGRHGMPSFKADRSHLRVWIHRFEAKGFWRVEQCDVRRAMSDWLAAGYSARELRHRFRILEQLYTSQGAGLPNPCAGIRIPSVPKPRPISVSDETIRAVAISLKRHERECVLRDTKTRARYLVLASTGQRPTQVMRAQPIDVDLERRIWFVRPAKGSNGATLYLNDDMVEAWRLFIAADAWGKYDCCSFSKTLQRNGWPKGIRPYALRHSVGIALSALGVDLGDIQAHLGHTSPATTRMFYVPGLPERMRAASERIDGRLRSVLFDNEERDKRTDMIHES